MPLTLRHFADRGLKDFINKAEFQIKQLVIFFTSLHVFVGSGPDTVEK